MGTDLTGEVIQRFNFHAHDMLQRHQITEKPAVIEVQTLNRTCQFYMLPKVHRNAQTPPGRPTVPGVGGPTKKTSQIVDHLIGPIVPFFTLYLRDSI